MCVCVLRILQKYLIYIKLLKITRDLVLPFEKYLEEKSKLNVLENPSREN